jgi:hypothetical protein
MQKTLVKGVGAVKPIPEENSSLQRADLARGL